MGIQTRPGMHAIIKLRSVLRCQEGCDRSAMPHKHTSITGTQTWLEVCMQLCSSASMTRDWCCRVTFAGVLIAFYIVTAIYEAKYLIPQTRGLSICHPDWAWCLAMGAAICWWLTSLVACGELLAFFVSWACSSRTASQSFSFDGQAHSAQCLT